MRAKPGSRLKSAVSDVQLMVVKAPADEIDLRCGGAPLIPLDQQPEGSPATAPDGQTMLGKRYADAQNTIELLCTKGGRGALTLGGVVLEPKTVKALPSSD
jgi:hypothetical protein